MTTASSLERTGDLSLYGTISMSLMIGVLLGMIVLALFDRGDDTAPAIAPFLADARADQLARQAVLGTPTDEHPIVPLTTRMSLPPRGQDIAIDTQAPGRHRRLSNALSVAVDTQRSLATMGLSEALARLAVDRVKRDAERSQFQQLLSVYAH